MIVTLYLPDQQPTDQDAEGFAIPSEGRFAQVPQQAASLLGCKIGLVDVLATGKGYVVYTVFDSEEAANITATLAVDALTGFGFNLDDEDELLRGPVVIVRA